MAIADVAWTQDGLPLETDYLDALRTGYDSGIRTVDFEHDSDGPRRAINAEVGRQTRGHIHDLMPPDTIDAATRLVLTDAVYLKAKWDEKLAAEKWPMMLLVRDRDSGTPFFLASVFDPAQC